MHLLRSLILPVVIALLCVRTSIALEDDPPEELFSPNHRFSIKLLHKALAGFDAADFCFTLAVYDRERCLSEFPTVGYLLEAFWSPDGEYVAVNNRRANNGDYLWVLRLADGKAVKKPVDADDEPMTAVRSEQFKQLHLLSPNESDRRYKELTKNRPYEDYLREVEHRVASIYPTLSDGSINHLYDVAVGWTEPQILQTRTTVTFFSLKNEFVEIRESFAVEADKLTLVKRSIKKVPFDQSKN